MTLVYTYDISGWGSGALRGWGGSCLPVRQQLDQNFFWIRSFSSRKKINCLGIHLCPLTYWRSLGNIWGWTTEWTNVRFCGTFVWSILARAKNRRIHVTSKFLKFFKSKWIVLVFVNYMSEFCNLHVSMLNIFVCAAAHLLSFGIWISCYWSSNQSINQSDVIDCVQQYINQSMTNSHFLVVWRNSVIDRQFSLRSVLVTCCAFFLSVFSVDRSSLSASN